MVVSMAALLPFRALRPRPSNAASVASVPYDVVTTEEARSLANGNPLSFLRISRAEIELPAASDPHAETVYQRAAANFAKLRASALVVEDEPSVYFYRLQTDGHVQTGLAACFSIDEYERNVIRKHERTRHDKEDDRTQHMIALGAQTGPVFLTYRKMSEVGALAARATASEPLFDFEADDGVRHSIWRVSGADRDRLVETFRAVPALYIADGHHRAASAARARAALASSRPSAPMADAADASTMLAVAFPHDEVRVLPYNRIVKDLGGLSPADFLEAVRDSFIVQPGPSVPTARGQIAMYVGGQWYSLTSRLSSTISPPQNVVGSLDVSVLQDRLLEPILGIADIRTDTRVDFIGGARGTKELETLVSSGRAAVAFSLFPVSVTDLMSISDAGAIMPPKSTWFEPKLRDGLLIHLI
jgi:uncharacterized protein (DUF1015 family)